MKRLYEKDNISNLMGGWQSGPMQESAKLYSRRFESGLALYMSVAQLVEHWSPKPAVGGSIPSRHVNQEDACQNNMKVGFMNHLTKEKPCIVESLVLLTVNL